MKFIGTYPNLRMRRNRKADWVRRLVSEHNLSANDVIIQLFVKDVKKKKLNNKETRYNLLFKNFKKQNINKKLYKISCL